MPRISDHERNIEFEFIRATENAALNAIHWIGKGDKEGADAAACDAIYGVFDLVDIRGEVMAGEGIKDGAPGIFLGDKLGTWKEDAPYFNIALDPIDGTTNISKGSSNCISVMAAAKIDENSTPVMINLPSYYAHKVAYGPRVAQWVKENGLFSNFLDGDLRQHLLIISEVLKKRLPELVVLVLDRPRNYPFIEAVRKVGASLRTIADGDVTAAVAPSLPDSGIDLYIGIGGTPEGILTATALKALGGDLQMRMWFRDAAEKGDLTKGMSPENVEKIYQSSDILQGESAIFAATGIMDSFLLPGVKLIGKTAITHSILMRAQSRTVRYIKAIHNLEHKTIHLRSVKSERKIE